MSRRAEGGRKGGTAEQKAERLRVKAERLARQADAWVTGIEREPAVARKLAELPSSYVVLSDVPVLDSGVRADHLVVGPGGLYLVDAKKYAGKLMYSKKMLWHGRFPITDKLDVVQWEADCLGQEFGRNVVPVLCFADPVLPQPVTTLGSVIVCRVSVLPTVVRSTHTTISAHEMGRIIDLAAALGGEGFGGDPGLLFPFDHDPLADPDFDDGLDDEFDVDDPDQLDPDTYDHNPLLDVDANRTQSFLVDTSVPRTGPKREVTAHRWRRRVVVAIAGLLASAATIGIVWRLSQWQEKEAQEAEQVTTTTVAATTTTEAPTTTSSTLPANVVGDDFEASCPAKGEGWTMTPIWPGTFSGLAWYDYAVQVPGTGAWIQLGLMGTPDPGDILIEGLEPEEKRIVRIVTARENGTTSERFVVVEAPSEEC